MSQLFSPLRIRDVSFNNRIMVSPMCQYSSRDGMADDWHLVHLGSRAVGGAGLVFTEATAVTPEGRISPADLGIWKDDHIEGLRRIVKFVRAQGSEIGIQLAHAGRKGSVAEPWNGGRLVSRGAWQPVAPSAIAFDEGYAQPAELSPEGIAGVREAFMSAARRAMLAGFKVIEIHAAHGYLLHQFLSPLSNRRKDAYGGSFENRIRLLTEVVVSIRTVWPAGYPLFVRISATDWAEGGWTVEDSIRLASLLRDQGVDLIDCSSAGLVPHARVAVGPGYQVDFSARIRSGADIKTAAVGMITEAAQAESILAKGQADLICMARQLLREPYFPLHAAEELGFREMYWPLPYQRARPVK
ncbi:MAG TPA: NADPH dehydrogenase NamA [Puia sp.]|nr:NADPH dehydrogenase NamA [Puia sp.]